MSPVKVRILIRAVKVPRSRPPELMGSECENRQGQADEGNTAQRKPHIAPVLIGGTSQDCRRTSGPATSKPCTDMCPGRALGASTQGLEGCLLTEHGLSPEQGRPVGCRVLLRAARASGPGAATALGARPALLPSGHPEVCPPSPLRSLPGSLPGCPLQNPTPGSLASGSGFHFHCMEPRGSAWLTPTDWSTADTTTV